MFFNPILSAKAIAWKNHHGVEEPDTTSLISESKNGQRNDSYGSTGKGFKESKFVSSGLENGGVPDSSEKSEEEDTPRPRERSYTRDANSSKEWCWRKDLKIKELICMLVLRVGWWLLVKVWLWMLI